METRQHADTFVINSPGINANDTVQGRRST